MPTTKPGDKPDETTEEAQARVEQETAEAREAAAKEQAERDKAEAEAAVAAAEQELEEAKADVKAADQAGKPAKGGGLSKAGVKDLREEQIDHGKAPIAPGPEEPVDPDDAARAKENRGRGLGG